MNTVSKPNGCDQDKNHNYYFIDEETQRSYEFAQGQ